MENQKTNCGILKERYLRDGVSILLIILAFHFYSTKTYTKVDHQDSILRSKSLESTFLNKVSHIGYSLSPFFCKLS